MKPPRPASQDARAPFPRNGGFPSYSMARSLRQDFFPAINPMFESFSAPLTSEIDFSLSFFAVLTPIFLTSTAELLTMVFPSHRLSSSVIIHPTPQAMYQLIPRNSFFYTDENHTNSVLSPGLLIAFFAPSSGARSCVSLPMGDVYALVAALISPTVLESSSFRLFKCLNSRHFALFPIWFSSLTFFASALSPSPSYTGCARDDAAGSARHPLDLAEHHPIESDSPPTDESQPPPDDSHQSQDSVAQRQLNKQGEAQAQVFAEPPPDDSQQSQDSFAQLQLNEQEAQAQVFAEAAEPHLQDKGTTLEMFIADEGPFLHDDRNLAFYSPTHESDECTEDPDDVTDLPPTELTDNRSPSSHSYLRAATGASLPHVHFAIDAQPESSEDRLQSQESQEADFFMVPCSAVKPRGLFPPSRNTTPSKQLAKRQQQKIIQFSPPYPPRVLVEVGLFAHYLILSTNKENDHNSVSMTAWFQLFMPYLRTNGRPLFFIPLDQSAVPPHENIRDPFVSFDVDPTIYISWSDQAPIGWHCRILTPWPTKTSILQQFVHNTDFQEREDLKLYRLLQPSPRPPLDFEHRTFSNEKEYLSVGWLLFSTAHVGIQELTMVLTLLLFQKRPTWYWIFNPLRAVVGPLLSRPSLDGSAQLEATTIWIYSAPNIAKEVSAIIQTFFLPRRIKDRPMGRGMSYIPKTYMATGTTKWNEYVSRQCRCWSTLEPELNTVGSAYDPYDILQDEQGFPRSGRFIALSMAGTTSSGVPRPLYTSFDRVPTRLWRGGGANLRYSLPLGNAEDFDNYVDRTTRSPLPARTPRSAPSASNTPSSTSDNLEYFKSLELSIQTYLDSSSGWYASGSMEPETIPLPHKRPRPT
jgi:hypothetical protein